MCNCMIYLIFVIIKSYVDDNIIGIIRWISTQSQLVLISIALMS